MAQRKVIRGGSKDIKARAGRFFGSFTSPNNFKRYWLNADGAKRAGKIAAGGFAFILLVFLYFAKDLPSPGKINARIGSQNTEFFDRTGQTKIFEIHGDKNRKVIEFSDMPQSLKDATISIEDRNFYKHGGFSVLGILRAAFVDVFNRAGGSLQGGSTITQQYVKNALLETTDQSVTRKMKELILSIEIESLYKKDDILKLYLNEIPYGNQAYGIEAACRTYFPQDIKGDKCTPNLTVSQSALLAAIPNAPTYFSPYGQHKDSLVERQHLILDRMTDQKYLTKAEADKAKVDTDFSTIGLAATPQTLTAVSPYPHFAYYAQEYLENKYGAGAVDNGGLKVITTLDVKKQQLAQGAIDNPRTGISAVRRSGGSNVAMVSADPKTGQVLAMIGSYDYNDKKYGAYNVALANRQPGSSFKPFVYATALKGNWGAGSTIYDVKTDFGGGYTPKNYSGRNYGIQSVRTALDGSLNIPAVKMLYIAGVSSSIQTAHNLGITTLNQPAGDYGLSLVLGSGEVKLNDMVNAYSSFANGGMHYQPIPVLKVTDPRNKVIEDNSKPQGKRVLDAQIAYIMSNVLSDDRSRQYIFGANNPLHINGRNVGAKTGTTEYYNDAWTMGFSPDLVTGVWAGNNDNKPMTSEAVDIAAPIWHDYMVKALADYPADSAFPTASGIQTLTLDGDTGTAVTAATKNKRTDIFPSWYKVQEAGSVKTAQVDKISGKLATPCTPPAAVQTVTSGQIHAEIPATDIAYGRWEPPVAALAASIGAGSGGAIPNESDNAHSCSDIKPLVTLTVTGDNPILITATVVSGTFTANSLTIFFDDQVISTQTISGSTVYTFPYIPTAGGSHTIKASVSDAGLYTGETEKTINITGFGP